MRLSRKETEAVEWLRLWAREGFPHRVDGSFPTDFFTAMRRLMDLPNGFSSRALENAFIAAPDGDSIIPQHAQWSWNDVQEAKRYLACKRYLA